MVSWNQWVGPFWRVTTESQFTNPGLPAQVFGQNDSLWLRWKGWTANWKVKKCLCSTAPTGYTMVLKGWDRSVSFAEEAQRRLLQSYWIMMIQSSEMNTLGLSYAYDHTKIGNGLRWNQITFCPSWDKSCATVLTLQQLTAFERWGQLRHQE